MGTDVLNPRGTMFYKRMKHQFETVDAKHWQVAFTSIKKPEENRNSIDEAGGYSIVSRC